MLSFLLHCNISIFTKDTEACVIVDGHQISHINHLQSVSVEDIKHLGGVCEYDM